MSSNYAGFLVGFALGKGEVVVSNTTGSTST